MSTTTTPPWLECVDLHPDVLSEQFSEDIFALDLGALSDYLIGRDHGSPDSELPRVPAVYRDPDRFFQASFLTSGLKSLLVDVLGRLSGSQGSRVLKLVTPFGGGKSHTLAALLHGARSRAALDRFAGSDWATSTRPSARCCRRWPVLRRASRQTIAWRGVLREDHLGLDGVGARRVGGLRDRSRAG